MASCKSGNRPLPGLLLTGMLLFHLGELCLYIAHYCCCFVLSIQNKVDWPILHKSHNAPVPYPTVQNSEHKCTHFCSEWWDMGQMHCQTCEISLLVLNCEHSLRAPSCKKILGWWVCFWIKKVIELSTIKWYISIKFLSSLKAKWLKPKVTMKNLENKDHLTIAITYI